jgi:hypothetical protein
MKEIACHGVIVFQSSCCTAICVMPCVTYNWDQCTGALQLVMAQCTAPNDCRVHKCIVSMTLTP